MNLGDLETVFPISHLNYIKNVPCRLIFLISYYTEFKGLYFTYI